MNILARRKGKPPNSEYVDDGTPAPGYLIRQPQLVETVQIEGSGDMDFEDHLREVVGERGENVRAPHNWKTSEHKRLDPLPFPQDPDEPSINPLTQIAMLTGALTYGEMIELGDGLWKLVGDQPVTRESLPGLLHQWSLVNRGGADG